MSTNPLRVPAYQEAHPDPKPPDMVVNATTPTDQMGRRHFMADMTAPSANFQIPNLPSGWVEMEDPSGNTMFLHMTSGQTSWQRPMVRTLPPGWQKTQTPDGKPFFFHPMTGTVSNEFPSISGKPKDAAVTPAVAAIEGALQTLVERKPLNRNVTAPVGRCPSMVHVNVNLDAVKVVPGVEEALAVHQLSTNNNCKVLSRQLGANMSQTTVALRDTTITAASLATRQAKVVTKTMLSPKRMQKLSKKMVIQTGALSVHAARVCKTIGKDMIDAADKTGKYQPKEQRPFIPYSTNASLKYQEQDFITITSSGQTSQASKPECNPQSSLTLSASANASFGLSLNAGAPARKPLRKPVLGSVQPGTAMANSGQHASPVVSNSVCHGSYNNTTFQSAEKPPILTTTADIEAMQQLQLAQQTEQQSSIRPPAPPKPTQSSISNPHSSQEASQGHLQFNMMGQVEASVGFGIQTTQPHQQQILTMRPQLRPNSSLMSPPPSYSQVVRPWRPPAGTPAQRPPRNPTPQMIQAQTSPTQTAQQSLYTQDNTTQNADILSAMQTLNQTHLSDLNVAYTPDQTSVHTHPVKFEPHQVQEAQYQPSEAHSQFQINQEGHAHQHQIRIQQHPTQLEDHLYHGKSRQESISGQGRYIDHEPIGQRNYTSEADQQAGTGICFPIQQNQTSIDQNALFLASLGMITSSGHVDQNSTPYQVYTQESIAMTNTGGAVAYEEVYFEGNGSMMAHEEMIYVDGEGGIAYDETTSYEQGDGMDTYEEGDGDGGFVVEDCGVGEDFGCDVEC